MALYAIDDLDDAWAATREFLTPVSAKRVFVLAFVVFFVGGTGINAPGGGGIGSTPSGTGTGRSIDALWRFVLDNALAIGLIAAVILLCVLAFLFVGALMEFVFVQSLRTDEVRFWTYLRAYLGSGLRLFGFRLALTAIGVLPALALLGVGFATIGAGFVAELGGVALVALAILAVCVLVLVAVVNAFTTAFVVPIMLVREGGVLDAWRAFWPTLRRDWTQYLAYGVGVLLLNIAAGILFFGLLLIGAIVFLVPLGIIVVSTALIVSELVVTVVAAAVASVFVLALFAASLLVQVPIQTYLRYYALFVLGDTDEALDPIPEIRGSVRESAGDPDPATI